MKFLTFTIYNINSMGDIAKAGDQLAKKLPEGYKIEAAYACQTNPFPGRDLPPGSLVTLGIIDCDNAESMASATLQYMIAGAESITRIPLLDITPGAAEELVENLK